MIRKKTKIIPPDGGWGNLVVLGVTLAIGTGIAPLQVLFSIIFGNFLSEIGDGPSSVATVTSVFAMCFTFTGVLANPLIQRFPLRTISLFGTMLFMSGAVLNIFVTKTWHLIVTFGILSGMGIGIVLPCVLTSFNSYFNKRRAFMNSLAHLGLCPLYIALPVCFQYSLENYGFRGTVAILCAFEANMFIAAIVLSPVEKHAQKEYELVTVAVNGKNIEKETKTNDGDLEKTENETQLSVENTENETKVHDENLENEPKVNDENTGIEIKVFDESSKLTEDTNNSIINPRENEIAPNNDQSGIWQQIIHMFDLTLLHEWKFINLVIGMAMFFYLDLNFLTLSPMFLIRRGFDPKQVAWCVTSAGIGDFVGRFVLTAFSKYIRFKYWYIYFAGSLITFICRNVFLIEMSQKLMLGLFFVTGFGRSLILTPIPILFTERYSIERFPAAWGLYSVTCGFTNIFLGAFIGSIADYFKNDTYTMHTFTIISSVLITTWFIQAYLENRPKKQ
ncbi:monocarboxylate transporter 7-like [Chrysoperla carnea]|uniref:monocarboxylate transporter 7-like n=1 Tax=Chrysoperla carnea TaxID=189513 RepID=UPI001D063AD5|nr:monocarboxylate transporter 7-like [Chrysoperla carnea]